MRCTVWLVYVDGAIRGAFPGPAQADRLLVTLNRPDGEIETVSPTGERRIVRRAQGELF